MPRTLRTAVIGAGHLGRRHAEKYAQAPGCSLRAVVDLDVGAATQVAALYGASAFGDFRRVLGLVDAVSIATPASAHYGIARECLRAGIDVLVEKPIALDLRQARSLTELARRGRRILQVGHIERFNPVTVRLQQLVRRPLFIECHRLAPFSPRGTDVDVVRDLMIHDLDLVLALTGAGIRRVEAHGAAVLTRSPDIVQARVQLTDGCRVNLTASRVSAAVQRRMRIFQRDAYLCADFQTRELEICRRERLNGSVRLSRRRVRLDGGDPLRDEIRTFLRSVATRRPPAVAGEDGQRALSAALRIGQSLHVAR